MYHTEFEGVNHELGTSGFLYRSNKLMYDRATSSMWSTLEGQPVIGPLVGKGIKLKVDNVVTTNWGEWRSQHPDTKVLSLETGHARNYAEGKAYDFYFSNDELMFPVPNPDDRLKNKASVFILRLNEQEDPIAFESKFLVSNPVHHLEQAGVSVVIVTDASGAHRAYDAGETKFDSIEASTTAVDTNGGKWKVTTDALVGPNEKELARLPSHSSFWFGWHAQFPETKLIKLEE